MIMSLQWRTFIIAAALLAASRVHAQSDELYRKDRLYVDIAYGTGPTTVDFVAAGFGNASYTAALVDLSLGNQNNRNLALLYFLTKAGKNPNVSMSGSQRIGIEYAATSWLTFGVGASHFTGTISGGGLNQLDGLGNLGYLIMLYNYTSVGSSSGNSLSSTLYTLPYSVSINTSIAEIQYAVHVQAGFADPYFRMSGGSAKGISKSEIAFGSRFRFAGNAYVYTEAFYTQDALNSDLTQSTIAATVVNKGARFGVGYAFDPPDTIASK